MLLCGCNVLETATTATTLPAGAVSGDRGDIFNAADLKWRNKKRPRVGGWNTGGLAVSKTA